MLGVPIRRFIALPIIKVTPAWVKPVHFTFLSLIFSSAALWIAWTFAMTPLVLTAIFLLILLYMLTDNLDGALCKERRISAFLGEYLDHLIDTFCMGSVVFIMAHLIVGINSLTLVILMSTLYLKQAQGFYSQYTTRWATSSAVDANEGFLIFFVVSVILHYLPAEAWILTPCFNTLTPFDLFMISLSLVYIVSSLVQFAIFLPNETMMWIYILSYAPIIVMFAYTPAWATFLFLVLYNLNFNPGIVFAHMVKKPLPIPDIFSFIALFLLLAFGFHPFLSYGFICAYMTARFIVKTLHQTAYLAQY